LKGVSFSGALPVTSPRDHLIDWLRDAHAMEEQAKTMLESQISRLKHYPEALPRLQQHLAETERQAGPAVLLEPRRRTIILRGR
jgi:Domain of unknown function (DUF892)